MKNFGKNAIKLGIITTTICCFLQSALCFGMEVKTKDKVIQNAPICQSGGGGAILGLNRFSRCFDCTEKVSFSEEKLKKAFPELFSGEEIDQYVQDFFQIDHSYTELEYDEEKRYCFDFLNGQFYKLYKIRSYEHPIYEDKQLEAEDNDDYDESTSFHNDKKDFIVHYKNGQLKAKRETSKDGKEIYYESYYNNGQIRSKEWRIVVKKSSFYCPDQSGNKDCTYLSEELIGLEEYYKNGQIRIKIEKGSTKKEFNRTSHENYLNIPYEMYDRNGKLKEKHFEDGTTEKYWENGNLRKKCDPVDGGELAGEQCCEEYSENNDKNKKDGIIRIRGKTCSHWIS